jgi:hypothetical protein
MQADKFIKEFSDKYFEENVGDRNFFADYIVDIFSKNDMKEMNLAEWGIGAGLNLHLLSHYFKSVHGYDGSKKAVESFKNSFKDLANSNQFFAKEINLIEKFDTPIKYDIIIYGFFAYVMDDEDLKKVKINLLNSLKDEGYVVVFDFLVRNESIKAYKKKLKIFKRNVIFWINYFKEFDLVDFRLFQYDKHFEYKEWDKLTIDLNIPQDDDEWIFIATFRRKNEN